MKYQDQTQEIFFQIEESHLIEIIFSLHKTIIRYFTPESSKEIFLKVSNENDIILSELITLLTLSNHKINYFLK